MKLPTLLRQLTEGLFFCPDSVNYWNPATLGLVDEKIAIKDADIFCFKKQSLAKPVGSAVYLYDGTKNVSGHIPDILWLTEIDLEVFMVDVSGFGNLQGTLSLEAYFQNTKKAVEKIRSIRENQFFFYGDFIGACAVLKLAKKMPNKISGILLSNAFFSYKSYFVSHYGPGLGHLLSYFLNDRLENPKELINELKEIPLYLMVRPTERIQRSETQKLLSIIPKSTEIFTFPQNIQSDSAVKEAARLKKKVTELFG